MRTPVRGCLLAALLLGATSTATAHEGPPFPILVDEIVGPYVVSVWTDPDIGIGTFYVVMDAGPDGEWVEPSVVRVAVEPVSGRLPEVGYDARPERSRGRGAARYVTEVEFDRGEFWRVRIVIDSPAGGGELRSEVEATPDGTVGPIGLLIYSLPFILVAALWMRAVAVRRRMEREAAEAGGAGDGPEARPEGAA